MQGWRHYTDKRRASCEGVSQPPAGQRDLFARRRCVGSAVRGRLPSLPFSREARAFVLLRSQDAIAEPCRLRS
jgi:hypothetical protein